MPSQASDVMAAGDTQYQKAMDGIAEMEAILSCLADDDRFQYALSKECVQKAIKHWIGFERLGPEESAELFDEEEPRYQELIIPALKAFKRVEAHCKRLGRPFPTVELMKGERKLRSKPQEERKLEEVREEAREEASEEARQLAGKQSHGMMIGIQLGFLFLLWLNCDQLVGDISRNASNRTRINFSTVFADESVDSSMRLEGDSHELERETCSGNDCSREAEADVLEALASSSSCADGDCADTGHVLDSVPPESLASLNSSDPESGWLKMFGFR